MSCQQASFVIDDPYMFTELPITSPYFHSLAQKYIPMKSSEQLSNEGKYASTQSQQDLHRLNELGKLNSESIYIKSNVVGYQTIKKNYIHCEQQNQWNPSLGGPNTVLAANTEQTVLQNKAKDWRLSAKNYHTHLEIAKDQRPITAMSIKKSQTNLNVENVSKPKLNHSNGVKASEFIPIKSIDHKIEPKQINVQQKLKTSIDIQRRQFNSFNGNDEHATDNAESLQKSINNNSTVENSSLPKSNDNKSRKQLLSERRTNKQKSDAETSINDKKKHLNGGKSNLTRKGKHDSLKRLPLKSNENGSSNVPSNNAEKLSGKRMDKEWHSPESYIYDDISTDSAVADYGEFTSCMQTFWFRDIPNENLLTREQRLENKRDNLRRQAFQYAQAQHFRSTILAKRRLITVTKALAKFKNERDKASPTKCSVQLCSNTALAMTAYCYLHITLNKDQKLFHPCTAKFSDNSQCRVPVFDISHELPLCREHAWKRDNYNRILQEQKPKKNLKTKTKTNETVRQPKRSKKKKKRNQLVLAESQIIPKQPLKTIGQLNATKQGIQPTINVVWNQDLFRKRENTQTISAKSPALMTSMNKYLPDNVMVYQLSNSVPNSSKLKIQNIISMGENSSAYESSEDTGVGELSESEFITAQDGIEIPLGDTRLLEEHDLTNVLNQLPVDAFNDLFQVQQHDHYEPTQKEQDELARALEEVDEQVKSLEQMTSSSNFLDSFDEILDGSDICDEVLTTSSVKNDIRGLVHI